ncbi:MAG: WbqC family protein [Bacteroidetes bacterium]|nr:WbqC family protein [Bacteroidota bacterium]
MILLSTAYFGNVQYFSKIISGEKVLLEAHESYTKQSYRNRCDILSSNGTISLSIPIKKDENRLKIPIREVEIDYSMDWQRQHWRSIVSAYSSSPYFEYFDYKFQDLFENKEKYLFDHNEKCLNRVLECMGIDATLEKTSNYIDNTEVDILDYRETISPKKAKQQEDIYFNNIPYYQVFKEKFPFVENLSILDLFFCEGRDSENILKSAYNKL